MTSSTSMGAMSTCTTWAKVLFRTFMHACESVYMYICVLYVMIRCYIFHMHMFYIVTPPNQIRRPPE